jgi:NitT/TauT family transport system permease protein
MSGMATSTRATSIDAEAKRAPARRWSNGLQTFLWGALGVALAAAAGELAVRVDVIDGRVIPPPSDVLVAFADILRAPEFQADIGKTLSAWALALGISGVAGAAVGILIGSSSTGRTMFRPIVDGMRSTSAVALIPIAILAFGVGLTMKVNLAVYAAIWPMIVGGISGASAVEPRLRDVARLLHWSRPKVLVRLVLPTTAPYLITALRTSSAVALIVIVSAELVAGSDGIGNFIRLTQQTGFEREEMFAAVAAAGLLGLVIDAGIGAGERQALRWHPAHRAARGA